MSAEWTPDEERAARRMHERGNQLTGETLKWEMLHPQRRVWQLDQARAALSAAAEGPEPDPLAAIRAWWRGVETSDLGDEAMQLWQDMGNALRGEVR